ncbi:hypothetical protein [Phenylobacterium zucineum]|uniref:hypothetical protein n=1 Tax=Phenylobacterium zucineum TaxID=284016 RepID=UPI0002DB8EE3|nr:hypothetical protein [Phenylobacterium zucineum]
MQQAANAASITAGWLVGVMIEVEGEPRPLRHYYAVGLADRDQAQWRAVDRAIAAGRVATSPVGGLEPVQAVNPLTLARMRTLGLAAGEVRELGWRHPRRWMS